MFWAPFLLATALTANDPPDLRPRCIDWVAWGEMTQDGYTDISGPNDMLGHGYYSYRVIDGHSLWRADDVVSVQFTSFGHTAYPFPAPGVIMRGKRGDGSWDDFPIVMPAARDIDGRWFLLIPQKYAPEPAQDWRPQRYKRFVRVFSGVAGRHIIAVRGILLADLPKLFASAPKDACQRP